MASLPIYAPDAVESRQIAAFLASQAARINIGDVLLASESQSFSVKGPQLQIDFTSSPIILPATSEGVAGDSVTCCQLALINYEKGETVTIAAPTGCEIQRPGDDAFVSSIVLTPPASGFLNDQIIGRIAASAIASVIGDMTITDSKYSALDQSVTMSGALSGEIDSFSFTSTPSNVNLAETLGYYVNSDIGVTSLVYTKPLSQTGFQVLIDTTLVSFSAPNLLQVDPGNAFNGDITIECAVLQSLLFPVLTTCPIFQITNCDDLTTFDLSSLTSTGEMFLTGCNSLVTLNLPVLVSNGVFLVTSNTALTTISVPEFVPVNGSGDNYSENALTAVTVNAILHRYVLVPGYVSGSIDLSGGTNAAPTGQGITDKATLITRGVTVTTN